jgi:heme exporter protein B
VAELLRAALAIATKDARVEWRSRTALQSALVFAVLVLVIFNFARDAATVPADLLAPSVLWVTVAFASVIALNRAFAMEQNQGALDALLLAPVSRSAVFVGKYLANLGFVLLVEALTVPVFVLFFNVDLSRALVPIAGLLLLATIGFVAVGTVLSAMTVRTRFAELMLPVLLLPFLVPPVLVGVQATTRLLAGRPSDEIVGWFRFLLLYDLAFLTLALLLFPFVVEE